MDHPIAWALCRLYNAKGYNEFIPISAGPTPDYVVEEACKRNLSVHRTIIRDTAHAWAALKVVMSNADTAFLWDDDLVLCPADPHIFSIDAHKRHLINWTWDKKANHITTP